MEKPTLEHIHDFVDHSKKLVPDFNVNFDKDSSYLMQAAHGLVYPFNPGFMTSYITTVAGNVYYPKKLVSERRSTNILRTLMHELVHAYDAKWMSPALFMIVYLLPQLLAVPALLLCGVFASWTALLPLAALAIHLGAVKLTKHLKWVTGFPLLIASIIGAGALEYQLNGASNLLWFALSLLPVLPIPSPGRAWAELRGYGMSVYVEEWMWGQSFIKPKIKQFAGFAYFLMWPFKRYVERKLKRYQSDARQGILREDVHSHCWEWISSNLKGVHKPQGESR